MRIIGGRFRGTRLTGPGAAAAGLRPTADRVREAIFNRLAHGGIAPRPLPRGAVVLDLFAGTGALGLEALSRDAAQAVFVEKGRQAGAIIAANIARLRLEGTAQLLRRDATSLPPCPGPAADLVFLDPPYGQALGEAALASALAGGWLAPQAIVVWEESAPISAPAALTPIDSRRYGQTMIHILRHAP